MKRAGTLKRSLFHRHAAQLFAQAGFGGATTRRLASAAQMKSAASPFAHFKSKTALLEAVVERAMLPLLAAARRALRECCPHDRLKAMLLIHLRHLHGRARPFCAAAWRCWRELAPPARARFLRQMRTYEAAWRRVWLACHPEDKTDARLRVRLLLYGLNGTLDWLPEGEREMRRRLMRLAIDSL